MGQADDWKSQWTRHGPGMLLLARQLAATAAEAEDVVQEAFLRFWRSHSAARDPVAYLYACVRSCALETRRGSMRRSARERAAAREEGAGDLFTAAPEQDERRQAVEAALQRLPEPQREALVLKIWAGLSFEQIAQALDVPLNTAASRYRYALEKLRHELVREEVS